MADDPFGFANEDVDAFLYASEAAEPAPEMLALDDRELLLALLAATVSPQFDGDG